MVIRDDLQVPGREALGPFPGVTSRQGDENECHLKSGGGAFHADVSSRVKNMSVDSQRTNSWLPVGRGKGGGARWGRKTKGYYGIM